MNTFDDYDDIIDEVEPLHFGRNVIPEVPIKSNKLKMLFKALKFLDGKKTILVGVIAATVQYLSAIGVIPAEVGIYITSLTTLILGSAAVRTSQLRPDLQ